MRYLAVISGDGNYEGVSKKIIQAGGGLPGLLRVCQQKKSCGRISHSIGNRFLVDAGAPNAEFLINSL